MAEENGGSFDTFGPVSVSEDGSQTMSVIELAAKRAERVVVLARDAPRPLWPPREPDRVVGRDEVGWKKRRDRVGRGWAMLVVAILLMPFLVIRAVFG